MSDRKDLLTKLNELFKEEPLNAVDEELFQWYLFAYNGMGKGISSLDRSSYELFKVKLVELLDAVYIWNNTELLAKK
jgi:hypothetical protein